MNGGSIMTVTHRAIDGSRIVFDGTISLDGPMNQLGSIRVPGSTQPYLFEVLQRDHVAALRAGLDTGSFPNVRVLESAEYTLKGGTIHTGKFQYTSAFSFPTPIAWGAWQGRVATLSTSIEGASIEELMGVFESVEFHEEPDGLIVDSPTDTSRDPIRGAKVIDGLGLADVCPLNSDTARAIPKQRGASMMHGELFRQNVDSDVLLFITSSAIVRLVQLRVSKSDALAAVNSLDVQWLSAA